MYTDRLSPTGWVLEVEFAWKWIFFENEITIDLGPIVVSLQASGGRGYNRSLLRISGAHLHFQEHVWYLHPNISKYSNYSQQWIISVMGARQRQYGLLRDSALWSNEGAKILLQRGEDAHWYSDGGGSKSFILNWNGGQNIFCICANFCILWVNSRMIEHCSWLFSWYHLIIIFSTTRCRWCTARPKTRGLLSTELFTPSGWSRTTRAW